MKVKTNLCNNEEFKTVSFAKQGRNNAIPSLGKLYNEPRSINPEKVADLRMLLPCIPPLYHDFYLAIKSNKNDKSVIVQNPDELD